MPTEVYAWPEGKLYLYYTGTASAVMAYCQDIRLVMTWAWTGITPYDSETVTDWLAAGRGPCELHVRQLYSDATLFKQAQSATAMWADLRLDQPSISQSAGAVLTSAVFTEFSLHGSDGGLYEAEATLWAADVSAY